MGRENILQSDLFLFPNHYNLPPESTLSLRGAGSSTNILVKGSLVFNPFPYIWGRFLFPILARRYLFGIEDREATQFAVSIFVLAQLKEKKEHAFLILCWIYFIPS